MAHDELYMAYDELYMAHDESDLYLSCFYCKTIATQSLTHGKRFLTET